MAVQRWTYGDGKNAHPDAHAEASGSGGEGVGGGIAPEPVADAPGAWPRA